MSDITTACRDCETVIVADIKPPKSTITSGQIQWQLTDDNGDLLFTFPIGGGIIFSDKFLSALSAQLSEYQQEEKTE